MRKQSRALALTLVRRSATRLLELPTHVGRVSTGKFLIITIELGLLMLVIHLFRIEELHGFLRITPLIFGGFLVHAWLPLRFRLPCFVLLSMAAVCAIFGFTQGAGLIVVGLGLIGLCHLPIAFWARIVLIFAAAICLVSIRAEWIQTSWKSLPSVLLPILGAMFMFRLIIYLYDVRHEQKRASLWERLSYFFLLPNVCFPLFPVVDYQQFRRTYYDRDEAEIYQKGILWMFRGVTHLLLYRFVYYHLVPTHSEIQGLGGVVLAVVTTYLLYLRISGQFHLIIGILCLFGFNLPETHRLYFLASGFSDYWRRINIYWKDFMMKIFYYPSFMRLRRLGMVPALMVSTFVVFLGTWLLHSYQWFWLQGTFPLLVTDGIFWGTLGLLVMINTVYEVKQTKKKRPRQQEWTFSGAVIYSAKVVGMFVLISVLWTLWSSPTVEEFVSLMAKAGASDWQAYVWLGLALITLVLVGVLIQFALHRGWSVWLGSQPSFQRTALYTSLGSIVLVLLVQPKAERVLDREMSVVVVSLQEERLNERDEERLNRGYYEELIDGSKYTSGLWTTQVGKPKGWVPIMESEAVRPVDGVLDYELIPSYKGVLKEVAFRTNQWGMRDKEYVKEKPPGSYRIALLSSSYTMGAGVEQDQTFEALLEERLNQENTDSLYSSYEILNFSVGGYSLLQNAVLAEQKALDFDPDIIYCVVHATEPRRLLTNLRNLVLAERPIANNFLQEIIRQSGAESDMAGSEIGERLEPFLPDVLAWGMNRIAELSRARGITPVWIYVPTTEEVTSMDQEKFAQLTEQAVEAGFVILDLDGVYGSHDESSIQLAPWDRHLSALGHQLIADRLYQVLRENESLLGHSAQAALTQLHS